MPEYEIQFKMKFAGTQVLSSLFFFIWASLLSDLFLHTWQAPEISVSISDFADIATFFLSFKGTGSQH